MSVVERGKCIVVVDPLLLQHLKALRYAGLWRDVSGCVVDSTPIAR